MTIPADVSDVVYMKRLAQRIRELERIAEAVVKYRDNRDLGFSVAPIGSEALEEVREIKQALLAAGYGFSCPACGQSVTSENPE